jgi:SAM-dependent methyltransferase
VSVTEDDVKWCYRSILGREPDSSQAVRRQAAAAKDLRSLVLTFLGSKEFQVKKLHRPVAVPLNDELSIDVQASEADFSLIKERIRNAWTHLGAARPYFSVLAHKDFLPDSLDAKGVERFYASGIREAAANVATLKKFGMTKLESKTCVEYGCGLGRVTLGFAKSFKVVHAYDISANHLALAEKRAASSGVKNVEFHLCSPDRIIENLATCDFFYSNIVFQHNPPPVIRALIEASLKSLREGGIAIFQVPTFGTGYSFNIKEYLAKPQVLDMEMHCIPQREVFSLIADADCRLLEIRGSTFGRRRNWISNTFVVQRAEGEKKRSKQERPRHGSRPSGRAK